MNDLLSRLGMKEISPFFDECYEKAKAETGCPVWLTEDFLREAAKEEPYFGAELEELIAAIAPVKSNPDLVLFARTLYHMLAPRVHHEKVFGGLAFILFRDRFVPAQFACIVSVFATPAAVTIGPMAQEMGGDVNLAGQVVVWSTVVSAFTVFLTTFLLRLGGVL